MRLRFRKRLRPRQASLIGLKAALAVASTCLSLHGVEITELMYHLSATEGGVAELEPLEFIELHHPGATPLDLSGWRFDRGLTYEFPQGFTIAAGAYAIIAKDPNAAAAAYSLTGVLGPFEGGLSNDGETIRLLDANDAVVFEFQYGTRGEWPAEADGAGHSLVPAMSQGNLNDARSWTASLWRGGSPGRIDDPSQTDDDSLVWVPQNGVARYFKGLSEPSEIPLQWAEPEFEPGADWETGLGGFGYSNNAQELVPVQTTLLDMPGNYSSVYARYEFDIASESMLQRLERLAANVAYDDGYVLYLNGTPVASVNVTGNPPAFDAFANSAQDYSPQSHDLTDRADLLRPGKNVLAIQGHNGSLGNSSDFIMAPELTAALRPEQVERSPLRDIVVNELLANSDDDADWIELYNPSDQPVDLSGAWLSDDAGALNGYELPAGATIEPGGFLVLDQRQFTFGLSAEGEKVFLTAPDLTFVVDAYRFGPQSANETVGRFPDGAEAWFLMAPNAGAANPEPARRRPVVLNELMYHAPAGASGDYVELWNTGAEAVDVSGWHFIGIDWEFPDGTFLAPNEIIVLADDPEKARELYSLPPESVMGNYAGSLDNGGERVELLDAFGVGLDWIDYDDEPPWPLTADGLGASLERSCLSDGFNQAEHWRGSPLDAPTPGAPNTVADCAPRETPPVVLNEIHYHPFDGVEDERRSEFIELWNFGDQPIDLSGWGLDGDAVYRFPEGMEIQAGDFLLLAWDPEYVTDLYELEPSSVLGPYRPELDNGGGSVFLFSADGRVVDAMFYDDDFPWPTLADSFGTQNGFGHSLERRCPERSGLDASNWDASAEDAPTPLAMNRSFDCDGSPRVVAKVVQPDIVTRFDEPAITVALNPHEAIAQVEIEFRVDDMEIEGEPSARLEMVDAGDGIWSVRLPSQPDNSIVRFRIWADTGEGPAVASPRPGGDAFEWHGYFVDPQTAADMPEIYHLFISSENWRNLHQWTAAGRVSGGQPNPTWNNEAPAVFVAGGEVFDVTVRHQGSRWNRTNGSTIPFPCPSHAFGGQAQVRSWRIRFPNYRNYNGVDVMILQKQEGWPQRVSFEMFKMAGVPAPETSWAHLRINGCDYNTDAFQIERPGRDLVARWFPEAGDLFKSQGYTGNEGPWTWGDARLIQSGFEGFRERVRYKYTYDRKTLNWKSDRDDASIDLVQPMIEGLHAARDQGRDALRAYLLETFDVDLTLRYIATINYVGTFDDMFQNHFLYRKAEDGKWCMLPWDMDNTLGGAFGEYDAHPLRGADESRAGNVGNRSGWWNRIKDSFFIAFEEEFYAMFHYLNNHVYSPEQMAPVVEASGNLRGVSQGGQSSLLDHIERRHDYLNQVLPAPPEPPFLRLDRLEDNRALLSWDIERFGYRLQFTEDLGEPWQTVDAPLQSDGVRHRVEIGLEERSVFFRLSREE